MKRDHTAIVVASLSFDPVDQARAGASSMKWIEPAQQGWRLLLGGLIFLAHEPASRAFVPPAVTQLARCCQTTRSQPSTFLHGQWQVSHGLRHVALVRVSQSTDDGVETDDGLLDNTKTTEKSVWPALNRQLLGMLGGVGLVETAYLTYQELFVNDLSSICNVGGLSLRCGDVLSSEWAKPLGIPLTIPGMAAYAVVAVLAVLPLLKGEGIVREETDRSTREPLLFVTTAMATFSTYLMWLLATQIKAWCPFCIVSAALSFSMAALTWATDIVPSATKAAVYKIMSIVLTALLSGFTYVVTSAQVMIAQGGAGASGEGILHAPPQITTHSDARTERLAADLQRLDAKMYGAFWCSHCYAQKEAFGQEAYSKITYIECAPDGVNSQTKMCRSRKVPGYPTWEVKGELYPGEKSLDELEEIVQGGVPAYVPEEKVQ